MSESSPAFSFVIPTYNRAHLIGKTIESALAQLNGDFELLVIDDGSTDDTEAQVGKFVDSRIQYHRRKNEERGAARNFGASIARGAYINFFDSDDLMLPNHLTEASKLIETGGRPEFFHLGYDYRYEDASLIRVVDNFSADMRDTLLFNNILSCNGVFLRRDVARQFPFVEDRVLASSEDWELWIRLVCRFRLRYSNVITSTIVQHEQRSLRTIAPAPDKVVARDLFFIKCLQGDAVVRDTYGPRFGRFVAERYTFFMLCFAEAGRRASVWGWGWKAFVRHPLILGSRRFLASLKKSLSA